MINLTPIAKPIQERLFEKMRVLGRGKKYIGQPSKADELQLQDMATRTTFIRMTSGQEHPVVMMGGELSNDKEMMAGFADIYGPKTYGKTDTGPLGEKIKLSSKNQYYYKEQGSGKAVVVDNPNITTKHPNTFKRPIPGIKSIDVQFKGGVRALRQATISWTCWSFEDLDRLMPHFLSHGKTVALEWGWVYNKNQFSQLDTLIKSDGAIDENGFKNYRNNINKSKGDFDFMNGVIKNFEYTSRDDGGFDCKTDIVSTGVSILNGNSVSGNSANRLKLYDIRESDTPNEILRKLNEIKDDDEKLKQIFFDSDLSFSIFMTRFDRWLLNLVADPFKEGMTLSTGEQVELTEVAKKLVGYEEKKSPLNSKEMGTYKYVKNSFIVDRTIDKGDPETEDDMANWKYDGWVRWGWFEDNVLNKFCAMISKDSNLILNEFRSVNRIIENDIPIDKFESVKIKNHKFLESTNLQRYILPGQFEVGDNPEENIKTLSTIVNDLNNFKPFAVDSETKKEGYLRNILVHTTFLKECFNFTENITVGIGLENMFNGMIDDHNLWELTIEADSVEPNRIKIIDNNVTYYPWDLSFDPKEQRSKFNDVGELTTKGVFTFPVWQNNSIVKKQNLSAKLPSSMQMAAMYGVNLDVYTNLRGSDQNMSIKGRAAGALGKMMGTKDVYKSNADLAFRMNDSGIKLGRSQGDESGPLNLTEGFELKTGFFTKDLYEGVKTFVKADIVEQIKDTVESKIPEPKENEAGTKWTLTGVWNGVRQWLGSGFQAGSVGLATSVQANIAIDNAVNTIPFSGRLASPATFPDGREGGDFKIFIQNIKDLEGQEKDDGSVVSEADVKRILSLYQKRYDSNMKLKSNFIEGMRYLLDYHGESRANNIPVLIPLELELSIDGIGGIYPGNSYHSNYVPNRYQKEAIFQCFDVNHTVDGSGWTVSLNGKMRATLHGLYSRLYTSEENLENLVNEVIEDFNIKEKPGDQYKTSDGKPNFRKMMAEQLKKKG